MDINLHTHAKLQILLPFQYQERRGAEILKEAPGDNNGPKDFTPGDESEGNAFWPLLGNPNGNGIAWLLADHKKSLKGKTIEKITACYREEK